MPVYSGHGLLALVGRWSLGRGCGMRGLAEPWVGDETCLSIVPEVPTVSTISRNLLEDNILPKSAVPLSNLDMGKKRLRNIILN